MEWANGSEEGSTTAGNRARSRNPTRQCSATPPSAAGEARAVRPNKKNPGHLAMRGVWYDRSAARTDAPPVNQAAFFLPSKNCASSVEPFSAAVEASRSTVVVTASK